MKSSYNTDKGCQTGHYLCSGSDGLPSLNDLETKQVKGDFTQGFYETECTIRNDDVPTGKYNIAVSLRDNGGRTITYRPDDLKKFLHYSQLR